MAQLRNYWRPAGRQLARAERSRSVDTIEVAIINAVLFYGFEYLGTAIASSPRPLQTAATALSWAPSTSLWRGA